MRIAPATTGCGRSISGAQGALLLSLLLCLLLLHSILPHPLVLVILQPLSMPRACASLW